MTKGNHRCKYILNPKHNMTKEILKSPVVSTTPLHVIPVSIIPSRYHLYTPGIQPLDTVRVSSSELCHVRSNDALIHFQSEMEKVLRRSSLQRISDCFATGVRKTKLPTA